MPVNVKIGAKWIKGLSNKDKIATPSADSDVEQQKLSLLLGMQNGAAAFGGQSVGFLQNSACSCRTTQQLCTSVFTQNS